MKKENIKRELLTEAANLHIRENQGGEPSRIIEGYAILFECPSAVLWEDEYSLAREIIDRNAVTQELLDGSDIKFTMFHDRQLILARSNHGTGSLTYGIDDKGVKFSFEAPNTAEGDKALEAVRRNDISGCSFMFSTYYGDPDYVEVTRKRTGNKWDLTYRVKSMTGIYDFTLAADPAYPDASCKIRELAAAEIEKMPLTEPVRTQVASMRELANKPII